LEIMSVLNSNGIQPQFFLGSSVVPYTFTTGELDALKGKLQTAENALLNNQKQGQLSVLQMSLPEIRTLLRMIDMTYLQGLSGSNVLPSLSSHEMPMMNNSKQPPNSYVCRKCHIPGHFIQDCPNSNANNSNGMGMGMGMQSKNQNMPPPNYVCRKCNIQGHWIQDCRSVQQSDFNKLPPDTYVCHRCGTQGHWIKNCPTNGNPSFDNNKSQMSTTPRQNDDNNNNNNQYNNLNHNNNNNNSNNNNMQQQSNSNVGNGKFQKRFVKKTM